MRSESLYLTLAQVFPALLIAMAIELVAAVRISARRAQKKISALLQVQANVEAYWAGRQDLVGLGFSEDEAREVAARMTELPKLAASIAATVRHSLIKAEELPFRRWRRLYILVAVTFLVGEFACLANAAIFSSQQLWLGVTALACLSLMCVAIGVFPLMVLSTDVDDESAERSVS